MLWSYSGFLLAYITSMVLAQPNKTQICLKSINKANYSCEANQMIHVISRLYQEASEDCEVPDDACQVIEDTLSNGFTTECNGKVTCTEDLSLFNIKKTCDNITAAMTTILHECISDPPVNVCSTMVPSLGTHTLYLMSPNFPEESNAGSIDRACECDITGTDMSVEILEIKFLGNQNYTANLTLAGDFSIWESYPTTFLIYNEKVINQTNRLHVMFNAYNRKSQHTWIRITGTSNITTTCNSAASPATSPLPIASAATGVAVSSGTPIESISSSTSPTDTRTNRHGRTKPAESNTVAVAVGCVFAVLVVAAIIIVIVIMIRRNRRSQDDERSIKQIKTLQTNSVSRNGVSGNDHGALSPDYADVEPLSSRVTDAAGDTNFLKGKPSRTSRVPQSSDYAEITPLQNTETGNRDRQPTPHYFILEPMPYGGHSSNLSGANQVPAGSVYSESDTLAMAISNSVAVQKSSRERASGDLSAPNKSSLAFASGRSEELYASVASEIVRSTTDMGETKEKTKAKESKNKRISDTSAEGKSNNAYDGGDEEADDKHEANTKDRSWSKSNPDYQETGNVSVIQHDSNVSPPVPRKADGILNELGTAKETRNQEPDLSSKNKKSNKNRKEISSSSDTMKTSEAGLKEETQSKSETDAGSKGLCGPVKGANSSAHDTDGDDKLVMVDNVIYEGIGGHVQSRTGSNSKVPCGPGRGTNTSADDSHDKLVMVPNVLYEGAGPDLSTRNGVLDSTRGRSPHQVPVESEYEDVNDDRVSSSRLLICDTRTGGPSPYEEIVI